MKNKKQERHKTGPRIVPIGKKRIDIKEYTSKYRKFYAIWLRRKRQQQHEQ